MIRSSLSRVVVTACLMAVLLPSGGAPGQTGTDTDARILGSSLANSRAWDKLAHLCDRIGHRLSGSEALEHAVTWAAQEFERDGIEHVWTEPVMVPHWVRGRETASIETPVRRDMALLALGGSVGTPVGGVSGEVVVVEGFEELELRAAEVPGKIVLFNKPIEPGFGAENGYGSVVGMRARGPSAAARHGAVGMLIRSLGTADFRLPHTGSLRYEDDVEKIPAAAISAEDAARIARLAASGDAVRVRFDLGAHQLPDAESANVIAEIRGRELPEEIVLLGAHLDSWDVGDGAHDDGAGCVMVMETMRQLRLLGLTPRRTIRAVLFTNEENGLSGGKDYAERHGDEHHVVAIETDSGGAAVQGFGVSAGEGGAAMIEAIAPRLRPLGAERVFPEGGGADISPLKKLGVPVMGQVHDSQRYFDYHHTQADTLDKIDREDLDRSVAALTLMAWALAEQSETLPRLVPDPTEE